MSADLSQPIGESLVWPQMAGARIETSWLTSIPSPSSSSWQLGSLALHFYGLIVVLGMILAAWITVVRYKNRGGPKDAIFDVVIWAIPLGIVGGRLWHVLPHWDDYFGDGKNPLSVFYIWEGGMAIFGAISLGAAGAYLALRRQRLRLGPLADSLAPGLLVAQALGRWGNYFNQELFGSSTTLPWGLEIDAQNLPAGYAEGTLFHPTFLYESGWNLVTAIVLLVLDRRLQFRSGQVFSLYLVSYGLIRFLTEFLRLDESGVFGVIRTNQVVALLCIIGGIVSFLVCGKLGRPTIVHVAECARYYQRHPKLEAPQSVRDFLEARSIAALPESASKADSAVIQSTKPEVSSRS